MTRGWHIREVYERYQAGEITFDEVIETAELGIAEFEERRAVPNPPPRSQTPPSTVVPAERSDS